MDGAIEEDCGNTTIHPLQGYFFGSSIELPETTEVRNERASLVELVHRTKKANQDFTQTGETGETQVKKTHRSAVHIMRRMFTKVQISSRSCTEGEASSTSTN